MLLKNYIPDPDARLFEEKNISLPSKLDHCNKKKIHLSTLIGMQLSMFVAHGLVSQHFSMKGKIKSVVTALLTN